jgi:flagellar motor switch protein FliG
MVATQETKAAAGPAAGLSGVEKVAILLLALGKSRAAKLLKRFDEEDLKLLSRSVGDLRPVTAGDLEGLVEEFGQRFSSGVSFVGTATEIRDLLSGVLPNEQEAGAAAPPEEAQAASTEQVWQKVAAIKIDVLREILLNEHPQTVALILTKLDPETAAKAIGTLPADHHAGLMCRMLAIRQVSAQVLTVVESRLAEELVVPEAPGTRTGIADILNRLEKAQSEAVLQSLAEARPDDAKALKRLLFRFEDLATLPPAAGAVAFNQVPIERLIVALKGTDAAFQAPILASLAARSRRMVEAELQSPSAPPPREVADARRAIVDIVLKLMAKGEIVLAASDDPDAAAA